MKAGTKSGLVLIVLSETRTGVIGYTAGTNQSQTSGPHDHKCLCLIRATSPSWLSCGSIPHFLWDAVVWSSLNQAEARSHSSVYTKPLVEDQVLGWCNLNLTEQNGAEGLAGNEGCPRTQQRANATDFPFRISVMCHTCLLDPSSIKAEF